MKELLDFYQQEARAHCSTIPWFAVLQQKALHRLQKKGFPTTKEEDWKYTPLHPFWKAPFPQANADLFVDPLLAEAAFPIAAHILIYNGNTIFTGKALPRGVVVTPLLQAVYEQPSPVQAFLKKNKSKDGFSALNLANLQAGVWIHVPPFSTVEEPIVIQHWQDASSQTAYSRNMILLGEEANASVIECFSGKEEANYVTNAITEIYAASKSSLIHYKIQQESNKALHLSRMVVEQAKASRVESHLFHFGAEIARSDNTFHLQQERASCLLNGVYMPSGKQHIDNVTKIEHEKPNCSSLQDYKGILAGESRAIFNGKVVVAKDAQHSQAHQKNKNLLLSLGAEIDTKPQLEIFADDVICSHGATVGQLDKEALFYLATRGIAETEASQFLVHAFVEENLRLITNVALRTYLATRIQDTLGW